MLKTRNVLMVFFLLFCTINSTADVNKITRDYAQGKITKIEKVKLMGYRLFAPERLPALYKADIQETIKCGTPIIADLRKYWSSLSAADQDFFDEILQRPYTQNSLVSPAGKFRLHFDTSGFNRVPAEDGNSNGIPDYIDQAAQEFDYCYSIEIDTLQYRIPPSDNGVAGEEIDVYFQNLSNAYGYTDFEEKIPNSPYNIWTSYIVLDNDYAESGFYTHGLDAVRVTAAHEFFHVIHLGYNFRNMDLYFFEMSSTWMEDRVYNDINDYYAYLPSFLPQSDKPITYSNGAFEYGAAIFLKFIQEKYSDDIIRRTWEQIGDYNSIVALKLSFDEQGIDFSSAFNYFAVWNYFTGARSVQKSFYKEAEFYPIVYMKNNISFMSDTTIEGSGYYLSVNYFNVLSLSSGNISIYEYNDNLRTGIIIEQPVVKIAADVFPQHIENIGIVSNSSYFVLIATNTEIPDDLELSLSEYPKIQNKWRITKNISYLENYIFPNPYLSGKHIVLKVDVNILEDANLTCSILTENGRLVHQHQLGEISKGQNLLQIPWNGQDKNGEKIASGVYLCLISGDDTNILNKFTLLRE